MVYCLVMVLLELDFTDVGIACLWLCGILALRFEFALLPAFDRIVMLVS